MRSIRALCLTGALACASILAPERARAASPMRVIAPQPRPGLDLAGKPVTQATFDAALGELGDWKVLPGVGRVWKPSPRAVGIGFRPYLTNGTWRHGEQGWEFDSEWPWGWVVFHYGNWAQADKDGWVWIPGTQWAPSWADWRYGGGVVAWAPLPPSGWAKALPGDAWTIVRGPDLSNPKLSGVMVVGPDWKTAWTVLAPAPRGSDHGNHRWQPGPAPAVIASMPVFDPRATAVVPMEKVPPAPVVPVVPPSPPVVAPVTPRPTALPPPRVQPMPVVPVPSAQPTPVVPVPSVQPTPVVPVPSAQPTPVVPVPPPPPNQRKRPVPAGPSGAPRPTPVR
jgi:hypothetical protein